MCLEPNRLRNPKTRVITDVACRKCRRCRDNWLNDWVGRCIAEQSLSTETVALTLTYAGEGPETALLRYSDFQNFMKRLRKDGYSVRYMVAGEYGPKKGRAHWHAILFFRGKAPNVAVDHRVDWPYWPHGFSYFQTPDYGGFRYVLKYALKNQTDGAVKSFGMSKKPAIGYEFFMNLADELVAQGLPLKTPEYRFADVRQKDGKLRSYWLTGRLSTLYSERYCASWLAKYGRKPIITDYLKAKVVRPAEKLESEKRSIQLTTEHIASVLRRDLGSLMFGNSGVDGMITAYADMTAKIDVEGQTCLIDARENVAAKLAKVELPLWLQKSTLRWLHERWSGVNETNSPLSPGRNL